MRLLAAGCGLLAANILTLVFSQKVYACGVCFFDVDHPMVHGMNAAIFFLLGILAMVLGCFLFFIIHLFKKHQRAVKAGLVSS